VKAAGYAGLVLFVLSVQLWSSGVMAAPGMSNEQQAATTAFRKGRYRLAVVHYQRLLRESPDNAGYRALLAESYEREGYPDLAAQQASRSLAVDRNNVDALLVLGRLRARQEDWSAARGYFERASQADRDNSMAWAGLGQALTMLGDSKGAEAASARYLECIQKP
jgi:Flp pilus assembly protein TadD